MKTEQIISDYMPLVRKIAARYSGYGVPYEDIVQEGLIGLLEASKVYRESEGVSFGTYAPFWIKKYIITALNKETKSSMQASQLNGESEEVSAPTEPVDIVTLPKDFFPEEFPLIERIVIVDSYIHKMSLHDIAVKLNITREKARQIRNKAARRLRTLNLSIKQD
jgi:RNA polymerase sigma factor (sigma-70 family)